MFLATYPELKQLVTSIFGLTKDAIHVYVGFLCLVASVTLLRRRLSSYGALLLGLLVSCAMEFLDLRLQLARFGDGNWLASLHDVMNTNAIPFMIVQLTRWRWFKT